MDNPSDQLNAHVSPSTVTVAGKPAVHDELLLDMGLSASERALPGYRTAVAGQSRASVISLLLRHKWLMIGVFTIISVLAVPSIWLVVKPEYASTAVVRIDPIPSRMVFMTENNASTGFYQSYLNTQVSTLRSPTVLNRVLDQPRIRATYWYAEEGRSAIGSAESPLERLQKALGVQTRPQTELIQVSISTRKPGDAKLIVDSVVDEYIKLIQDVEKEAGAERIDTLRKEYTDLQQRISGQRQTQLTLSRRFGTLDLNQLRSQLSTDLHRLETERAQIERLGAIAQWQLERLSAPTSQPALSDSGRASATRPATLPAAAYAEDSEWRRLHFEAEAASHALENARREYGSRHPKIGELEANLAFALRMVKTREGQLDIQMAGADSSPRGTEGTTVAGTRGELEKQLRQHKRTLELLDEEIRLQAGKVAEAGDVAQQMSLVDEQIRQNQETNEEVRRRIEALEMESKAPARIQVNSYGIEATKPDKDRRLLLTGMALAGALMAGAAVTYLRGTLDARIQGVGDVPETVQVPFLGHLCHLPGDVNPIENDVQVFNEGVRMIRTSLLQRVREMEAPVVLVTSPLPQCGKTTTAVLLARSLATLEKRVLLVETDLRHPSVAGYLQVESEWGLANVLSGEVTDDQAIVRAPDSDIQILLAGANPALASLEYLANGQFAACLQRWKTSYDYILLDAPPVLPVADARILAAHADGTVMVLRSSRCRRLDALESYACLSACGGTLLGTVLVGGYPGTGNSYGYYYHHSEGEAPQT